MSRQYITLNEGNQKVSITLPTSFTEARELGTQPLRDIYNNGSYFVRDLYSTDIKQWFVDNIVAKPGNALFALNCLTFIYNSMFGLLLLAANAGVMAYHYARSNSQDPTVDFRAEKFQFAGSAAKLGLLFLLPSGLMGLGAYVASCYAIDSMSSRAKDFDTAKQGAPISVASLANAYGSAAKQMADDVKEDITMAVFSPA